MTNTNLVQGTFTNAKEVGELKGLLAVAREQGQNVAIIRIPVRLFAIDEVYQTDERTERDLSYLTKDFRKDKLLPVTGVPHDEEGKIYLVDGYGRWKASQIVDKNRGTNEYEYLDCMVILNAPTEPEARRTYEAEQFAYQNKNVSKLTALQKHGALKQLKDSGAIVLDEMKDKYKFIPTSSQGIKTPGYISYTELYNICKNNGKECADYVLRICNRAGYHLQKYGYSACVLRGLRDIWKYYPNDREKAEEFLTTWLRERTPEVFKAKAVTRYPMPDYRSACSLYLEDLLVDNIDLLHARSVEGKSITMVNKAS